VRLDQAGPDWGWAIYIYLNPGTIGTIYIYIYIYIYLNPGTIGTI